MKRLLLSAFLVAGLLTSGYQTTLAASNNPPSPNVTDRVMSDSGPTFFDRTEKSVIEMPDGTTKDVELIIHGKSNVVMMQSRPGGSGTISPDGVVDMGQYSIGYDLWIEGYVSTTIRHGCCAQMVIHMCLVRT